ncbi:MAG TPA: SurA N-terminal domain-containing protein [Gemmatimonadales bacterium]
MMRTLRGSAKWIMGVVAFFFVGWMIYGYGMDITGRGSTAPDVIARVNGEKISATAFYAAVRNEQERIRQEYGSAPVTLADQRALEDQVLEQLVQAALMRQEYRRRGIRVSDEEIVAAARTSPLPELVNATQFQTDGQFDMEKYQRFVSSSVDPEFLRAIEARYREELPRIKLYEQITAGTFVSDAKLWQQYRDERDSVTATVLALFPGSLVPDSAVTLGDRDVEQYFRAHRDDFERPATAFLSYVTVSRVAVASDTAAALQRALGARAEIVAGAEFADVAARESSDTVSAATGGDLGDVPRGRFIPVFEEAALALRPGEISQPVQSQFGFHVIKLESKSDSSIHPHHILIPIELAGDHLNEVESRADTLDLFAAEQDDPAALDDVAEQLAIPVETATPLFAGNRLLIGSDFVADAAVWAFGSVTLGQLSPVIETDMAYYVFRLDSLTPAGVPPLEDVRVQVRRTALRAAKLDRTRQLAREISQEVTSGISLEDAAARRGLTTSMIGPFTRYAPPPEFQGAPRAAGAAFALGVGEVSSPVYTDIATFFVRPIRKVLADSATFTTEADARRVPAMQTAQQQRWRLALESLRRDANVVDLRDELERLQQKLANAGPQGPLGY